MKNRLDKTEKEIIIGLLLGDGYLNLTQGREAYLEIKQSKEKLSYVKWLHNQLKGLRCTKVYQRRDNLQWYFRTQQLKCLTRLKKILYRGRRKIIPLGIEKLLTSPLSLAVWYMDDGNIDFRVKYHYSHVISTNNFTFKEVESLVEVLSSNFDLQTTVNRTTCRGKRYPRIYIGAEGRERFLKLVKPYILPCFRYKLPYPYRPLRD